METKVVENNYKVLSNLEIGQKLYVKESGELVKDDRWLQGLRRRRDGVSREDIKEPIRKTLICKLEGGDKEGVEQMVRKLKIVLYGTYPDFTDIQDMMNMLLGELPDTNSGFGVERGSELVVKSEETYLQGGDDDSSTPLRGRLDESVIEESVLEESVIEDSVLEECVSDSSDVRRHGGFIARLLGFLCIKY